MNSYNGATFYYNGIRIDGHLNKGTFSIGQDGTVYLVCDKGFDAGRNLWTVFEVENDSDPYTDYFDYDSVSFPQDHPAYPLALTAARKKKLRDAKRHLRYNDKYGCYDKMPDLCDRAADLANIDELERLINDAAEPQTEQEPAPKPEPRRINARTRWAENYREVKRGGAYRIAGTACDGTQVTIAEVEHITI